MPVTPRLVLFALLGTIFLGPLAAQAYLPDLKNEDLPSLDQRLKTMGVLPRTEPLLATYLAFGKNAEFVGQLLARGCNPNQKAPGTGLSPLSLAITRDLSPAIVSELLQSGAGLESRIVGVSGNIIDAALDRKEYQNASLLVKANLRGGPSSRLVPSDRFKDYPAFFLDDLVQVRSILRNGDFPNSLEWNLALAGNSRKVLKYLMDFQIEPNFNAPGSPNENVVGINLLASNIDLLKYLLSDGLARDEVNFERFYLKLFADKNLDSVKALKAIDTAPSRPTLYRPALAAGLEFLRATTNNLADLTETDLFVASATGEAPLLVALLEKSDWATILPLLQANPSGTGLAGLYQYAFAKKNLVLLRNLSVIDTRKVRPDLYSAALDAGIESLKAITHDLEDFKNPSLFGDGNQDNGREKLISILWQTTNRRTLLEAIYEKTDFATLLAILEALNPPQELLVGKQYSAAYQQWLNRANKDILTFGFPSLAVQTTVEGTEIAFALPALTDVRKLVAVFTLSGGRAMVGTVSQISGVTVNDFSSPVSYLVVAQDGSRKTYTVTVTLPPPPPAPEPVPEEPAAETPAEAPAPAPAQTEPAPVPPPEAPPAP